MPGRICSCALPVSYHRPQSTSQLRDMYNISGALQYYPAYLLFFKLLFQIILFYLSLVINRGEKQILGLRDDSVALNTNPVYAAMPLPT